MRALAIVTAEEQVLVLNTSNEPVNIARSALGLLIKSVAVIDETHDW